MRKVGLLVALVLGLSVATRASAVITTCFSALSCDPDTTDGVVIPWAGTDQTPTIPRTLVRGMLFPQTEGSGIRGMSCPTVYPDDGSTSLFISLYGFTPDALTETSKQACMINKMGVSQVPPVAGYPTDASAAYGNLAGMTTTSTQILLPSSTNVLRSPLAFYFPAATPQYRDHATGAINNCTHIACDRMPLYIEPQRVNSDNWESVGCVAPTDASVATNYVITIVCITR